MWATPAGASAVAVATYGIFATGLSVTGSAGTPTAGGTDPDPVVTSPCQQDALTIAAQYSNSTLDPASGFTQPKVNRYYLTGVEPDACKGRQISVAVLIDNRSDPHCQVSRLTDTGFITTTPGSMHQDLPSEPGDVMLWSFKHRSTEPHQTDSVELMIGDSDHQNGGHPMTSAGIFTTAVADGWVTYSGAYTVPNGQRNTRFELRAAGGSTDLAPANIDAASFTPDYCLAPVFKELPTKQNVQASLNSYTWNENRVIPRGSDAQVLGFSIRID